MAESTKVVTGKVRLGYPNVFKARAANEKQDPKFSVEILIPKSDTATVAKIRKAQNAAAQSEKGRKIFGTTPPVFGDPKFNSRKFTDTLRDGDDENENDGHPERIGHWFMSARAAAQFKPKVVDKNMDEVIDESLVYGGVYGRVSMKAFPFDTDGNKGVSFGLDNVQTFGYGEPFGAPRDKAEDDFGDDFEDDGVGAEEDEGDDGVGAEEDEGDDLI